MSGWTTRQNAVLRAHATEGADAVTLALFEETGVARSVSSVRMHASRAGISLAIRFVCPACGHIGGPKDFRFGDGLCEACHVKRKTEALDRKNERLADEYRRAVKAAYTANATARKRTERIRKRFRESC